MGLKAHVNNNKAKVHHADNGKTSRSGSVTVRSAGKNTRAAVRDRNLFTIRRVISEITVNRQCSNGCGGVRTVGQTRDQVFERLHNRSNVWASVSHLS